MVGVEISWSDGIAFGITKGLGFFSSQRWEEGDETCFHELRGGKVSGDSCKRESWKGQRLSEEKVRGIQEHYETVDKSVDMCRFRMHFAFQNPNPDYLPV